MILLLGGTGSTAEIALALARAGYRVLVSKATDVPLDVGRHARIESRAGELDERGLVELIDQRQIRAVVDATHPYATVIRGAARRSAEAMKIPYFSLLRPAAIDPQAADVEFVADHAAAAQVAFAFGLPVLLTTGVRNLAPYAAASRRTGLPLVVRVLERPASRAACLQAGIPPQHILAGRGPFSVEENRRHLRAFGIGVLVTKDSGRAGGVLEKLQAARNENCRVIVLRRPDAAGPAAFSSVSEMLRAVRKALPDYRRGAD
jgi:precorrin-6A/cobalt-precorrin-6A reductase